MKDMYCEHCGKELKENEVCECRRKGVFGNKKVLIAGFAVIVAIVMCIVIMATRPEKMNLGDYITKDPHVKGFNGYATIEVDEVFDENSLQKALLASAGSESYNEEDWDKASDDEVEEMLMKEAEDFWEAEIALEEISQSLDVILWKNGTHVDALTELANGDVVKVEVSADNTVDDYFNVEFLPASYEFTISGLEEGIILDVFAEGIVLIEEFGIDGEGYLNVYLTDTEKIPDTIDFHVENNYSLKNADVISISAVYDKDYFLSKGYCLKEEEITYTVSGLGHYLQTAEEIPDDFHRAIVGATTSTMNDWFNRAMMIADEDVAFENMYFAKKNPELSGEAADDLQENGLYIIGRYEQESVEKYCYMFIPKLVLLKDGTLEVAGVTNLTDLYLDIDDWGYSKTEIIDVISCDDGYILSEVLR